MLALCMQKNTLSRRVLRVCDSRRVTLQFRCNLLEEKANSYPNGDKRGRGEGIGQTGAELALPRVKIWFECLRRNYKFFLVISATMFTPIALLYDSDTNYITLIRCD